MEFKTECKVDGHQGFAHVVEQEYNPHFKVWYGCVNILCDKENIQAVAEFGSRFSGRQVQMELEDGRSMTIFIGGHESELHQKGVYLGCYFVSLTPLIDLENFDPETFMR